MDTSDANAAVMGKLGPVAAGQRSHFCVACDYPAETHARCAPCLHVFCMSCAASMATCLVCAAAITKIEPIPSGAPLFVSPATLQGFRTAADLSKHVQQISSQLSGGR